VGAGDGDGGDGGGFGAEDAGAEGDGLPGVLGEEGHLFGGPAALGADGEGVGDGVGGAGEGCFLKGRGFEGGGEGEGLLGLGEKDAGGGFFLVEGGFEGGGVGDFGDIGAAGLLGGFVGDAAPAVYALGGGEGEVLFGAAGEDGGDAGYAELGGLFDGPLEVVELEDGEVEVKGEGGVGFELLVEAEGDFLGGDGEDLGAVQEAGGDDVEDLAGLGAEDAGEVGGLVAEECGGHGAGVLEGPGVGDPAAAGHDLGISMVSGGRL
jgi:hypothetical protein